MQNINGKLLEMILEELEVLNNMVKDGGFVESEIEEGAILHFIGCVKTDGQHQLMVLDVVKDSLLYTLVFSDELYSVEDVILEAILNLYKKTLFIIILGLWLQFFYW